MSLRLLRDVADVYDYRFPASVVLLTNLNSCVSILKAVNLVYWVPVRNFFA